MKNIYDGVPLSDRVEMIYSKYYNERVWEKVNMLEALADMVVDGFSIVLNDNYDVYLDFYKITSLVESYYLDVIEYKELYFFSLFEKDNYSEKWMASVHKRLVSHRKVAALSIKWILKYQPIQIHPELIHTPSKEHIRLMLSVNEVFAMMHTFKILKVKIEWVEYSLLRELDSHMRYNVYDEKHFFIIYEKLMELVDANNLYLVQK